MNKNIKHYAYEWLLVVLASICNMLGSYVFIYANKFAPGGVAGIVNMINHFVGDRWSGIWMLAINVPMLIIGFFFLSRDFALKTTVHIVLAAMLIELAEFMQLPQFVAKSSMEVAGQTVVYDDSAKFLIASVVSGALLGLTVALMFMAGGSTGGTDIPAAIMQRKNEFISVSWMIFIVNAIIIACSCIIYPINPKTMEFNFSMETTMLPVIMAMINLLCASAVSDLILSGGKTALKFEVVTQNPEELAKDLMDALQHGVTLVPAEGMYSHTKTSMLICIVAKREITDFKRVIAKYPNSFAFRSTVNEVYGKFRKRKNEDLV